MKVSERAGRSETKDNQGQGELEGGRNRLQHMWDYYVPIKQRQFSFLITDNAKSTKARAAVKWILHFLVELQYFALINFNLIAIFSPLTFS